MSRIAIIGSGISGLGCAWFLHRDHEVTVFEADSWIGGHAHTVFVDEGGRRLPIDTGFMVFNHVTYPQLLRLFRLLDVPTCRTDMSFSVQHGPRRLEYRGTSLNHLFAQRRNLFRPAFWELLRQIDRFNSEAVTALCAPQNEHLTVAEYVAAHRYGDDFLQLYLLPMSSAVWSTAPERMLQFPAGTLLRFFHNHGFLGLHTQHPWWTIAGGSQSYVQRLIAPFRDQIHVRTPVKAVRRSAAGVEIATERDTGLFDQVIFACHAPTALRLLGPGATALERSVLSAFHYQSNPATLHTDRSVMPRRQLAWSAWNFRVTAPAPGAPLHASTHYWMNQLQGVSRRHDYFVSLNAESLIDPTRVVTQIAYEHPVFDLATRRAQARLPQLSWAGERLTRTFFAGAWQGYGFHEDGLNSALAVSRAILQRDPWESVPALALA